MLTRDPRARPLLKERVPYVVLCGAPGSTYKSLVVHPRTLLSFERGRGFVREGGGRRINSTYYILNATLPPLHRALILVGIDVKVWYREMPRVYDRQVALGQLLYRTSGRRRRRASTIDHYVFSSPCLICSTLSRDIFCETCIRDEISKQISISIVTEHHRNAQRSLNHVLAYCARCSNVPRFVSADGDHASTHCDSITCPVFHRRLNLFSDQLYYRIALDSTLDW
jgi:DNA polymerase zeta